LSEPTLPAIPQLCAAADVPSISAFKERFNDAVFEINVPPGRYIGKTPIAYEGHMELGCGRQIRNEGPSQPRPLRYRRSASRHGIWVYRSDHGRHRRQKTTGGRGSAQALEGGLDAGLDREADEVADVIEFILRLPARMVVHDVAFESFEFLRAKA
jgi:hypothetical protein